jgi:type 1 glutamine amidotransferase
MQQTAQVAPTATLLWSGRANTGKGRVFNVGWGHPDATWDDARFQKMMLEGIKWALGMTPADVTPKPFPRK